MKRATKADKEAARKLLGHEPPAEPHKDLRAMVRELIAEGARQGIRVEVDMIKVEGGDPWISDRDLQALQMQGRRIEGVWIDEVGWSEVGEVPSAFDRQVRSLVNKGLEESLRAPLPRLARGT